MTYRVAFSAQPTGKIPQGDSRWGTFNDSFRNQEVDLVGFADQIYMGHAYTSWMRGRRNTDNFVCSQWLGLDFDTCDSRSSIDSLMAEKFIREQSAIIHTTPSHKQDAPKARAIFCLDQPIHQAKNYRDANNALIWMFESESDSQCKDAARFFYGSKDCDMAMTANTMSINLVKILVEDYRKHQAQIQAAERKRRERALQKHRQEYPR